MTSKREEVFCLETQAFAVELEKGRLLETLLPFVVDREQYMTSNAAVRIMECGRLNECAKENVKFQLTRMREILIERFISFDSDEALVRNFDTLFPFLPLVSSTLIPTVPESLYTLVPPKKSRNSKLCNISEWEFCDDTMATVNRLLLLRSKQTMQQISPNPQNRARQNANAKQIRRKRRRRRGDESCP
eukprot:m.65136 g.65136  ORF g.65136 m.65136 type:complete len:189 (+) comp11515_c2_seq1:208-774(+)